MDEIEKPEINKKFDPIIAALKKIGLKPLFSTTHPRDYIYAVECLSPQCREFWPPNYKPTHEKTCTNPHRKLDEKEIQKIMAKNL